MPIIGLGTWNLKIDTAGTIEFALRLGYRLIDTSGDYGTQPGIAEGLKRSGLARDDFYIVTKVEEDEDAYRATKKNLRELDLDYADLILIHRPPGEGTGEELWRGLMRAKEEGLTKDIGVSNYSAALIGALFEATGDMPVVNEIEWTPFGHSEEMLAYTRDNDIAIMAYSPLTHGKRLDDPTLVALGEKYGKTPAQILIRWNVQRGTVPIPKSNKREHLEDNLDVFDFKISVSDMQQLNELNEWYSSLGFLEYLSEHEQFK